MDPPNNDLGAAPSEPDQPSCQGCRRRKLRCSRDKPVCTHCQRLGSPCVYDAKKSKPGVKPGAIEALNRRVESLENAVFDDQGHIIRESSSAAPPGTQEIVGVFSSLIQELRGLVQTSHVSGPHQHISPSSVHPNLTSSTPGSFVSPNDGVNGVRGNADGHGQGRSRKRRRVDSCGNPNIELADQLVQLANDSTKLPPPEILEEIIGAYFSVIQPWIPVVHETRFRRRLNHDEHTPELVVLLHAMVVAAARFVDEDVLRLSEVEAWMTRSRSIVRLSAMEGMSVENLQALIIIAFHDMGNGDMSKAWPLIGSLTRTVEYLQLSVEMDDPDERPQLKPLSSIEPAQDWTQDEERRRVFWTIFNLDRLCSVMTGWNTSLTSDDVRRRLPACGSIWHKEDPVTTPYFGIWDRSAAKIGNSIAFLPAHYPSPEQTVDAPQTPAAVPVGNPAVDMTTVGAFAYCIEATESLSRVTTYFLQQGIDFRDRQQVGNWLTRFKELDLRLVHWKMFLPRRWKDSNISRKETKVEMDPNLTLAHVTHNTSMVLLHQQIAYPPPRWTGIVRMPSAHSAETCQVAAAETATIAQKYLRYTPRGGPVSSQFAFCVFISARALLVHWRYYGTELASEFWMLVECLDDMSKRWAGSAGRLRAETNLAGRYASQLKTLHGKCSEDSAFSLDALGYIADGFPEQSARQQPKEPRSSSDQAIPAVIPPQPAAMSNLDAVGDTPRDPQGPVSAVGLSSMLQTSPANGRFEQHSQDELSAISTALMDQDFTQLDRVISFDDMSMSFSVQACNGDATTLSGGTWNFGQ